MAWRIDEQLIHGEIDNRTRGRVTGTLWFLGLDQPVTLELEGNAWRDVAGHVLRFRNTRPAPGRPDQLRGFAAVQRGVVGDITASRKVRVPDCPVAEMYRLAKAGQPYPWHWGNCLYLEWHGERNGRVVIESTDYEIEVVGEAVWTMDEAEEEAQREANGRAMLGFMERLTKAMGEPKGEFVEEDLSPTDEEIDAWEKEAAEADADLDDEDLEEDDDDPTSRAEADADAEQARMDLLLDRVQARLERAREAGEKPDHARIMEEERERLRRERGEPEPEPPTPEEEAERAAWIEEMNAIAEEALKDYENEKWKRGEGAGGFDDELWHPLVERCNQLTHRMRKELKTRGWLAEEAGQEHPLREVIDGVMIAGGKLAGALGTIADEDDWPPDPLTAGATLNRLKKARAHLRDALAGLDAADEQGLAEPDWRATVRAETREILAEVARLITEVRAVLKLAEDEGESPRD